MEETMGKIKIHFTEWIFYAILILTGKGLISKVKYTQDLTTKQQIASLKEHWTYIYTKKTNIAWKAGF